MGCRDMSVWTLIVERNRYHETNFSKPWESAKGFEAHVMYGPPDSELAWSEALVFLEREAKLREPDYRLVGMMKGNFGTNFYTDPRENDENSSF